MEVSISNFLPLLNEFPQNPALTCERETVSHAELKKLSDTLAANLIRRGIGRNDVVAVQLPSAPQLIASILGIAKAGATFLPLDISLPDRRIDYMIKDSGAKFSICAGSDQLKKVSYEDLLTPIERMQLPHVHGEDAAYIIYTSGTTGHPKGVQVSHNALLNYLQFAKATYLQKGRQGFGMVTSPSVDMTITSMFLPLISGGCLHLYHQKSNLASLQQGLTDKRVTFLKCTPTHLTLLGTETLKPELQTLIIGGEALPTAVAKQAKQMFPNAVIINEYGPTETTVGCTFHEFDPQIDKDTFVPIGKPITGAKVAFHPRGGDQGELLIGGKCIAIGYVGDSEKTKKKFKTHADGRYYRSGDLVQLRAGEYHYIGRIDDQLKVNGYRVEPAEIERHLLKHPAIEMALIKSKGHQIQAYLKAEKISRHTLDNYLSKRLPRWMIPADYHICTTWNVKSNGKLDEAAVVETAAKLPLTVVKDNLDTRTYIKRRIIAETSIKHLNNDTDLFFVGMESLFLVHFITDLEEHFNCTIDMSKILKKPSIETIARCIEGSNSQADVEVLSAENPIFCFPPAIGGEMSFRYLQQQAPDLEFILMPPSESANDPSAGYCDIIEKYQGHPPTLLGYSGGGNVAFEVCKLLEKRNYPISAIIMIDAYRKTGFPEGLPSDIVNMRNEASQELGPGASASAFKALDTYYEMINFHLRDFEGQVDAELHLLTSSNRHVFGNRKVQGTPYFKGWEDATSNTFVAHRAYGDHARMLKPPHVTENLKIIRSIIGDRVSRHEVLQLTHPS